MIASSSSILHQVAEIEPYAFSLNSSIPCDVLKATQHEGTCNRHPKGSHPVAGKRSSSPGVLYHLHTLHLFTSSDYKLVLFPQLAFGLVSVLSGSFVTDASIEFSTSNVISRLPLVSLWIYLNLLPFTIRNQSTPSAILEDALNKPHRPIPSGRLTQLAAHRLTIWFYGIAVLSSMPLGAVLPSLALWLLGFIYNDLGGGDTSAISRNLINAAGHTCFSVGATIVTSSGATLNLTFYQWIGIIIMIIATTIQVQDLPDQEGDAQRNRKTLPLTIGDGKTRWTVAVPVMLWSITVLKFWEPGAVARIVVMMLSSFIAARVIALRTVRDDKKTWRLWNFWMTTVFCLPLAKTLGL